MSHITPHRLLLAVLTLGYLVAAAIYFTSVGNTEFLGYIAAVALVLGLVACTLHITCLPDWLLWLLSFQMLLHILGGGVMVNDDVLYNYVVYPVENPAGLTFLKFDQVVHTFGSLVAAFYAYFFLARAGSLSWLALFILTALAAMGIGAINEMLEFAAKLSIPDTDVGGYYNTAVDLCVNFVGAVLGAALAVRFWKLAP